MSKTTYKKPYSTGEWNFELNTQVDDIEAEVTINDRIAIIGNVDVEVEIFGTDFSKTANTGTSATLKIDVIELINPTVSSGELVEISSDFLRANRDLSVNNHNINGIVVVKGTDENPIIYNEETGDSGINIFSDGKSVTKDTPTFTTVTSGLFNYSLQRNKEYLIRTTGISGDFLNAESFIFGVIRVV